MVKVAEVNRILETEIISRLNYINWAEKLYLKTVKTFLKSGKYFL